MSQQILDELRAKAAAPRQRKVRVRVVANEYGACPRCGAYWGHPDKSLDFPNRQKVDHYWKCFNPSCTAAFYDPDKRVVVEDKLSPEEEAAMHKRVKAQVEEMFADGEWVEVAPNQWQMQKKK